MNEDQSRQSLERREFLRRAAITGAAAAWAVPVIQTLNAGPAFAQAGTPTTTTTPSTTSTSLPTFCGHSVGGDHGGGCMGACTGSSTGVDTGCNGNQCNGFGTQDLSPCDIGCPQQGMDNPCCNPGLCDSANFHCEPGDVDASYCGPTVGCNVPFVTTRC
jgi:hypothetical protein